MKFVTVSGASTEAAVVYYSDKRYWVMLRPIAKYLFSRCEDMQKSIHLSLLHV